MKRRIFIALFTALCACIAHGATYPGGWVVLQPQAFWYEKSNAVVTLVVENSTNGVSAGDVLAPVATISVARVETNTPVTITSAKCFSPDNNAPAFTLLLAKAPLTWPATNAVATLVTAEAQTNLDALLSFGTTEFKDLGTNMFACKTNLNIELRPMTNTIFIYAMADAAITNTNSFTLEFVLRRN